MKRFLVRHRRTIKACIAGGIAGIVTALLVLYGILFGYYNISPQDVVRISIIRTEINGTKEDGSPITGFTIETEDGSRYLITDYYAPIYLSEGER